MSELSQDALMYFILVMTWFFGGAAVFGEGRDFIKDLQGWFYINICFSVIFAILGAIVWAVSRVST